MGRSVLLGLAAMFAIVGTPAAWAEEAASAADEALTTRPAYQETFEVGDNLREVPETAKILFVSNRDTGSRRAEIYAMDADGGNVTRITTSEYHHFILGIDPSHRFIVSSRVEQDEKPPEGLGDEDRRSIWMLDLVEKTETRLTDPTLHFESKTFSPDGEWIACLGKRLGEDQCDVYKMRRDGSELTNLTDTLTAIEGDPQWSNGGNEIVFNYLDQATPRFVVKTMDPEGKNMKTICDLGPGPATKFPPGPCDPTWSPDDQWLVFERAVKQEGNGGNGVWHIFRVQRDGTGVVDLSEKAGHAESADYLPSISPDGKQVIFGTVHISEKEPEKSHNDIYVMDADGANLRRLTEGPGQNMYPIWVRNR